MTGRGLRGRRRARALIVLAVVCGIVTLLACVAQPGYMRPMFAATPWPVQLLPVVGLAIYFIGLGWMVRIYRADPEPYRRSWRYRDF